MSFVTIIKTAAKQVGKQIVKHSPEILTAVSIASSAAAIGFAVKGTFKAPEIIDKYKDSRYKIRESENLAREIIREAESGEDVLPDALAEAHHLIDDDVIKKDLIKLYVGTGIEFAKVYAPAIACFALSGTTAIIGLNIIKQRLAKVTLESAAALSAFAASFDSYRNRVRNTIGTEAEEAIYKNEKVEMKEFTELNENGDEVKTEKAVVTQNGDCSPYAFKVQRGAWYYEEFLSDTLLNLKQIENECNEMLVKSSFGNDHGLIVENDVRDKLDAKRTTGGSIVGVTYWDDPIEQEKHGDGYVDFGLFDHSNGELKGQSLKEPWATILRDNPSARTDDYDIWLFFNFEGPVIDYYGNDFNSLK